MTLSPPIIELHEVSKDHGGAVPLRIQALTIKPGDRLCLQGLDRAAAETLIHLVSGAALPDEGRVVVGGADTRAIATDTDWLVSLDRFGIVTSRAVLLESLSVAANIAVPITLAVDPMSPGTRHQVESLAAAVELIGSALDGPVNVLDPLARARLHLARALALTPELLLLEHPTADFVDSASRVAFGRTLRVASDRRGLGWLVLSNDDDLASASGGQVMRLEAESGRIRKLRRWWPWR